MQFLASLLRLAFILITLDLGLLSSSAHVLGDTGINHSGLEATESVTFSLLSLLEFLKKLCFHAFKLLSFGFIAGDLLFEVLGIIIDISPCHLNLLSDKFILAS